MSRNLLLLIAAALLASVIFWHLSGVEVLSAEGAGLVLVLALGCMGAAIAVSLIPAGIYWLFKRRRMPYLSVVVWGLWGVLALAYLIMALRLSG